jgi:hypothetical protein
MPGVDEDVREGNEVDAGQHRAGNPVAVHDDPGGEASDRQDDDDGQPDAQQPRFVVV